MKGITEKKGEDFHDAPRSRRKKKKKKVLPLETAIGKRKRLIIFFPEKRTGRTGNGGKRKKQPWPRSWIGT